MGAIAMAGQVVAGRYLLVEQLGHAEVGASWRAHDDRDDLDVMVTEVWLPDTLDEVDRGVVKAKIVRDAQIATELDHPGVVRVLDVVEDGGGLFVVNELVVAPTLSEVVAADGTFDRARVTEIGVQLLDALSAAHAAGVVHRRVNPSVVRVPDDGPVRLGGFGISSVNPPASGPAAAEAPGMSPFTAPELADAPGAGGTTAADVWSAGATLWFAFDGRVPSADGVTGPARESPLGDAIWSMLARQPLARPAATAARDLLASVRPVELAKNGSGAGDGSGGGGGTGVEEAGEPAGDETTADTAWSWDEPPAEPPETAVEPEPSVPEPWFFPNTVLAVEVPPDPADFPTEHSVDHHVIRRIPLLGRKWQIVTLSSVVILVLVVLMVTGGRAVLNGNSRSSVPPPKGVPSSWLPYRDPELTFLIWHPPTWTVDVNGTTTVVSHPSTVEQFRVDRDSPPMPAGAGVDEREQAFAANHPGYLRQQITRVSYGRAPAVLWEYTYPSGGTTLHAADLSFPTQRYTFSLTFQTSDAEWNGLVKLFTNFKASFRAIQKA